MSTAQIHVEKILNLLGSLYDNEAFAKEIEDPTAIDGVNVVATYKEAEGDTSLFAISCELSLANSLGAALVKIPPGSAQSSTNDGEVPENIADNLHEVLNICSSVFADLENQRIVLEKMYLPGQERAEGLDDKLNSASNLLQVNYELDRYQPGKLSLLQLS